MNGELRRLEVREASLTMVRQAHHKLMIRFATITMTKLMKDSSANILLRLLRAALGHEAAVSLPSDIDWQGGD